MRLAAPVCTACAAITLLAAIGANADRRGHTAAQPATLAVRAEAACRTTHPIVAAVVQTRGLSAAAHAAAPAVVAVHAATPGEPAAPEVLATNGQVGAVYGLAYDPAARALFVAAHTRRGAAFGPGGPGMIYRIDLDSGAVAPWHALAAGEDVHAPELADHPTADDTAAMRWVGRIGLGDIELSNDGTALHAVNLSDRHVHTLALADGAAIARFRDKQRRDQFDGSLHPFALAVSGDDVLFSVTDGYDDDYPPRQKAAWVYAALPDGNNRRTTAYAEWAYTPRTPAWGAWDDKVTAVDQPWLVDVAVRPGGALILGMRDRTVDMAPDRVFDASDPAYRSVGELFATRFQGITWRAQPDITFDTLGPDGRHAAFGAVAVVPGLDVVVAPTLPLRATGTVTTTAVSSTTVGLAWFDAASGRRIDWTPLFDPSVDPGLALEVGAGDVAVLCGPTPPADVDLPGTATAVGAPIATATAIARGTASAEARNLTATAAPSAFAATQTAHAPTEIARATDARATATAMAPTAWALETQRPAAQTAVAGTATVVSAKLATAAPAMATRLHATALAPRSAARQSAVVQARATIRASDASDNPYLAVANHVPVLDAAGNAQNDAWMAAEPVVIAFNNSEPEDILEHHTLAWHDELGAVFGIASDIGREQLYVGAFVKRVTQLGPLGPGGIYRIDLPSGAVAPFAVLNAGADPHDFSRDFDVASRNQVGRIGLGDLEYAPERDELFAVNLSDRLIYRFHVPDGRLLGAFPHGAVLERWARDARPFALGWHDGRLYHGVVDEAGDPPAAYVYRSNADGSDMAEVARLPLDYPRAPMWADGPAGRGEPSAMLVDLEFRNDGDLVIGLRDRTGDSEVQVVGSGDVILTTRVGDRFVPLPAPELYNDTILHQETAFGSLAAMPWLDQVASTAVDPITVNSNGVLWYDNTTGQWLRRETIHAGLVLTFAKAAGLGDMESLNVAPTPTHTPTPTDVYTRTPSPSPTATLTPPPTVTPSPTTGHFEIYLPLAQRLHCVPFETRTDVVLVLDMSTSMYRPTRGNRTKHEAAVDAAHTFVGLMRFAPDTNGRRDRVGVVGFNNDAWIGTHLTSDRAAVDGALDGLARGIKEGTRLDLAIAQGQAVLDATPRAPGIDPVLILLTDGLPNRVPTPEGGGRQEDTVLAAASAAKAAGTRLFAVGLGETGDVFESLLAGAASGPGDFFMAPDGEDLAGIYRGIAGRLTGCP